MDMVSQAIVLGKKPHVIIATPGRLVDHLENTKGFNLRALKYLVIYDCQSIFLIRHFILNILVYNYNIAFLLTSM